MSKPLDMSYFTISAYLILLAMVADMLDGRLARMSQSTSSFGGQLDSLCDVISFGLAPAFLMLEDYGNKLAGYDRPYGPGVESFLFTVYLADGGGLCKLCRDSTCKIQR